MIVLLAAPVGNPSFLLVEKLDLFAVPVDLLHVVIHLDRQQAAALRSASFQDPTSVLGGHAVSKAVLTHATADFWLVCSLRHFVIPQSALIQCRAIIHDWTQSGKPFVRFFTGDSKV